MGSTSTVSFIFLEIVKFSIILPTFFCIKLLFLDLNKSLVLNLFLILNIGESTGPKMSSSTKTLSFFLISWAALKLSWLELAETIKAISLEYGGKFLFFLTTNSLLKNFSGLFSNTSFNVSFNGVIVW